MTAKRSAETLVIVHPSWPFESRGTMAPRLRAAVLRRSELILARLADLVTSGDAPSTVVVGPYLSMGSGLTDGAVESLRVIRESATHEVDGGLNRVSLQEAGRQIGRMWKAPRVFRVAGFYRDLCCLEVGSGLVAAGQHDVRFERELSRCAPPDV